MTHNPWMKPIFDHGLTKFALITKQEYNKDYENEAYQQADC